MHRPSIDTCLIKYASPAGHPSSMYKGWTQTAARPGLRLYVRAYVYNQSIERHHLPRRPWDMNRVTGAKCKAGHDLALSLAGT